MGESACFVSVPSPGPTNLFLIAGCMQGRRHYEDIVFLFTEIVRNTRRRGPELGNKQDAVGEGNKNTTAERKYLTKCWLSARQI